jgi:hypothetical protein
VHEPIQEREHTCVLRVAIVTFLVILIFDFGICPTVWHFFWGHFIYISKQTKKRSMHLYQFSVFYEKHLKRP